MTSHAGWSARGGHTSGVLPDGRIVLMGGWDGSNFKNDVWQSIDDGATWKLLNASAGWSGRSGLSSVVMPDGSIVPMGGLVSSEISKNDVWRSTDYGATWKLLNASAGWSARYAQSSVVMPDSSIVLMGGYTKESDYSWNDVWRSTDYGATWKLLNASAGWSARYAQSSVVMPDSSIVLMGGGSSGSGSKNDVWWSTDYGATWKLLNASAGWSARYLHSSVVLPDGSIVLLGGQDHGGSLKNDVWRSLIRVLHGSS